MGPVSCCSNCYPGFILSDVNGTGHGSLISREEVATLSSRERHLVTGGHHGFTSTLGEQVSDTGSNCVSLPERPARQPKDTPAHPLRQSEAGLQRFFQVAAQAGDRQCAEGDGKPRPVGPIDTPARQAGAEERPAHVHQGGERLEVPHGLWQRTKAWIDDPVKDVQIQCATSRRPMPAR